MTERENVRREMSIPDEQLNYASGGDIIIEDDDKPPTLYRITCENPACAGWHAINATEEEVLRERTFGCPQCHTSKFLLVVPM